MNSNLTQFSTIHFYILAMFVNHVNVPTKRYSYRPNYTVCNHAVINSCLVFISCCGHIKMINEYGLNPGGLNLYVRTTYKLQQHKVGLLISKCIVGRKREQNLTLMLFLN